MLHTSASIDLTAPQTLGKDETFITDRVGVGDETVNFHSHPTGENCANNARCAANVTEPPASAAIRCRSLPRKGRYEPIAAVCDMGFPTAR